jgi:Caspase domain
MCARVLQVDYANAGYIVDDELFQTLVAPQPEGCELTVFLDCCHAGTDVAHASTMAHLYSYKLVQLHCVHVLKANSIYTRAVTQIICVSELLASQH